MEIIETMAAGMETEDIKPVAIDVDKATDSDEDGSDASSEDVSDDKEAGSAPEKQQNTGGDDDDDEDDDDKMKTEDEDDDKVKTEDEGKTDDADEQSDTATQRQSKRKPSKSRIKRILPQLNQPLPISPPDHAGPSSSHNTPLPSMDTLVMMGASPPSSLASPLLQHTMVPGASPAYLQQGTSSAQQRTPGSYKCDICGKEFRVPSRFESHMLSHSKGKPFCCDICGKLFASQLKLDIHSPVHSRDRRDSFSCPTCGHVCSNWRAYLYHVAKHTTNGGKKHNCEVCGRQFHAAQRLRNHMQSHIDGKHFCCLICGKLFESQKRLDTHTIIHDTERQEPFTCVDCGKIYDDWRAFKQHMKTHGTEGVLYRCEICSEQFYTQYEKEKHKRIHTSSQRYQCPHCNKCFRSQSQLAVHERKHQGDKNHECSICGRECARASSLKQHMKMHAGDEEFFCHLCGRTFSKIEELSAHATSHVGEREFACDQCGKCFAKKIHYHRHLMVHAAGQPFTCGVCGRHFENASQLRSHTLTHGNSDGSNSFACQACSDVFETQLELEAHAHTHGRSPPFVCGLCGKLFAEQRYFRQHMKRHTARSHKQKMQHQQAANFHMGGASPGASSSGSAGAGGLNHKCHMCGQQFAHSQALVTHIEEHKRSGLLMYFNLIDNGNKGNATQPKQGSAEGSDEESETASDSEESEGTVNRSRTTIHYGLQSSSQSTPSKANNNHHNSSNSSGGAGKGSLTEAAERAMALRMQAAATSGANSNNTAISNSINNSGDVVPHSPGIKSEVGTRLDGGGESSSGRSGGGGGFYSAPVFPGQMSGSHATPYHAAAAQHFQHNQHDDYADGNSRGVGRGGSDLDMATAQYASQKGLPGFADFRRHLGYPNSSGYGDYGEMSGQFSADSSMPSTSNSYPSSSMLPPTPQPAFPMGGGYDASGSGQVYNDMKMSVFPGMAQGPSPSNMGPRPQGLDMHSPQQPQFDPMLQFQPLGS